MCSEIPTMNFGKLIETSTCLQIGLAPPWVRTRRGERGWAATTNTTLGRGGGGAPGRAIPTGETGNPRGKGGVVMGGRNPTNTGPKAGKGTVLEAEEEKGTAAGAAGAGAAAAAAPGAAAAATATPGAAAAAAAGVPLGPGVVAGGQVVETELFRVPNPNKLTIFLSDCTSYLL